MQNLHNLGVSEKRFDFSGKKTRLQLRRVVSGYLGVIRVMSGQLKTKPVPLKP
jgi:hypothetical protein